MSEKPTDQSHDQTITESSSSAGLDSGSANLNSSGSKPGSDSATKQPSASDGTSITGAESAASAEQVVDVGMELGYYRLLKKLGEGGMGSVWLALHTKLDKQVAVKILPAAWSRNRALLSRFEREMKAVGRLEHPHIVRAMDAGDFQGTHYLVMEFAEGQDLSVLVKQRGPQTVANSCEMVRHAALGLAHAHEAGLIHRDIKPSNLFLTKQGKVKILDLGLARVQGDNMVGGQTLTGFGQVLGTPDYMAPEQWENTHGADTRSDLYALGCTLFFLLTGRAPYSDQKHGSLVGKMKGHTLDPIPDLKAIREEAVANRPKLASDLVSDELESLFCKLMAKKPEDRFSSAAELAEALLAVGKGRAAAASGILGKGRSVPTPIESASPNSVTEARNAEPSQAMELPASFTQSMPDASADTFPSNGELSFFSMLTEVSSTATTASSATSATAKLSTTSQVTKPVDVSEFSDGETKPTRKIGLVIGAVVALILVGGVLFKVLSRGPSKEELAEASATQSADADASRNSRKKRDAKRQITTEIASAEKPVEATADVPPVSPPTTDSSSPPDPQPKPTEPAAPADSPSKPEPKSQTPESAKPNESARTLVVGIGSGEINDFGKALEQAKPGDTILVRHRGPLEFAPTDLSGKTPLTIVSDTKSSVDFWPIVRQKPLADNEAPPPAKGLFFGKNLQLTFRKVHLGASGQRRQTIASVFQLDGGKLEFDDCTITVSGGGTEVDSVGPLIPLVQCQGTGVEPLDVTFQRTLVRGARLGGMLNAVQPGPIHVDAEQFLWAGAPASWLTLQECGMPCQVRLNATTLYNLGGLATANLTATARNQSDPYLLRFLVDRTLLTGPRVDSPPLLQVTAPGVNNLTKAVADKWLEWKGEAVVWHQITGDPPPTLKGATPVKAWCDLFGLEERSLIVADPMF